MNAIVFFDATWSGMVVGVSIGVTLICFLISGLALKFKKKMPSWMSWMAVALPLGLVFLSALFTVRGYEVRNEQLRVQRLLWDTVIPLQNLQKAEYAPNVMLHSWRLLGNGGFFSISGSFSNNRLGRYRALVTDPSRTVVLYFPDSKLVVSPSDPEAFARVLSR